MKHFCRNAFSLIELLSVIAVVAILASIIVVAVGRVRESAHEAQCASALRTLGGAMKLFIADNNGHLPQAEASADEPESWWYVKIGPYLSDAVSNSDLPASQKRYLMTAGAGMCPSSFFYGFRKDLSGIGASYGWNITGATGLGLYSGALFEEIPLPARTIHLAERWGKNTSQTRDSNFQVKPPWLVSPLNSQESEQGADPATLRVSHNGRSNYLFFDGHVESLSPEQTYILNSTFQSPNLWRGN